MPPGCSWDLKQTKATQIKNLEELTERWSKEYNRKPQTTKGTQGLCSDLTGFCIKVFTVNPCDSRSDIQIVHLTSELDKLKRAVLTPTIPWRHNL